MPPNQVPQPDSQDLQLEGSLWFGIVIAAVFYGVYLGIYYLLILALLSGHSKGRIDHRRSCFMMTYSTCQLILNTLLFISWAYLGQSMWVIYRNNHFGGPKAYFDMTYGHAGYIWIGAEAQNTAIFLSDALLIYRCYVIFGSNSYVVPIPGLFTFGYLVLGLAVFGMSVSKTQANPELIVWLIAAQVFLTTFTNVLVTIMISWKVLSILYRARKQAAASSTTMRAYTSVVAIFIESAAPSAILAIIMSAVNTHSNVYDQLPWTFGLYLAWCMVTALAPQLIMYRMAKGIAWNSTTVTEIYGLGNPDLATAGEVPSTISCDTPARSIRPWSDTTGSKRTPSQTCAAGCENDDERYRDQGRRNTGIELTPPQIQNQINLPVDAHDVESALTAL